MKNSTFSSFKRAVNRINTPKDFDAILGQAGLQRRASFTTRRALGWVGFFALGALAGGTAGIFLAPKRGQEMRDTVRQKLPLGQSDTIPAQEHIYEELN